MNRWVAGGLISAALIGGGAAAFLSIFQPRFPTGATAAGIDISGLTVEEAERSVAALWEPRRHNAVELASHLIRRQKSEIVDPATAGIQLDAKRSVAEAMKYAPLSRLPNRRVAVALPPSATAKWNVDRAAYEKWAIKLTRFNVPAENAKFTYAAGNIQIQRGKPGWELDPDATLVNIEKAFVQPGLHAEVEFAQAYGSATEETLKKITCELGGWTTSFRSSQGTRAHNIKLATGLLNGHIVLPGEEFSYNKTVGLRSTARGFLIAPTLKNGKHVPGVGGGVCQVSSTLYNSALLSGMKILERHNHQMAIDYVPLGRDATVNFGSKDLRFRNTTKGPVAVVTEYRPGRITIRILGTKDENQPSYKIIVTDKRAFGFEVKDTVDPTLRPGSRKVVEKGGRGWSCRSWRYVYKGEKLIRKEALGGSHYIPNTRIVAHGPAPAGAKNTQPVGDDGEA